MCEFKVLNKHHLGYVVKCEICENLHVVFGNLAFPIKETDFVNLYSVVEKELKFRKDDKELSARKIYLTIPGSSISMVFSINELKAFSELLHESYIQNEINNLIL